MERIWKDTTATVLTALCVLVFVAAHESWGPVVGDSRRWAALVILALGICACGCGDAKPRTRQTKLTALLGIGAGVLGVVAIATGSLTPLSLLVADIVLLWSLATLSHAVGAGAGHARPV
jgi:hypothetical protein